MPLAVYIAILGALAASALFLYGFFVLVRQVTFRKRLAELARALGLIRADENPIIVAMHPFEAGGVMNPAAVIAGGRTHLFYRAVGNDGISRIGYAWSDNGTKISGRLPYPVFALNAAPSPVARVPEILKESGGTWSGVGIEDPRAVIIGSTLFLTFNAFSSWNSLRIGVSLIRVDDFLNRRWKWTAPVYLSPPGQVQKSWVLFPETINGKFAVLHGFSNDRARANIAYLDSLEHDPETYIESNASFRDALHENVWDSKLRGSAIPPLKTKAGWLILYHANDAKEPHRYKLGAMLLDLHDPSTVIARSALPILEPHAWYENDGKPGIVYACGATLSGDTLRVYYGGGDKVVCVATTSLKKLLEKLVDPKLMPEPRPQVAIV